MLPNKVIRGQRSRGSFTHQTSEHPTVCAHWRVSHTMRWYITGKSYNEDVGLTLPGIYQTIWRYLEEHKSGLSSALYGWGKGDQKESTLFEVAELRAMLGLKARLCAS